MRVQIVLRPGHVIKVMYLEKWLIDTCPIPIEVVQEPDHSPDVLLVMYGAGSPVRSAMLHRHVARGGRVFCLDRGYYGRTADAETEHYRLAIDALHVKPQDIEATSEDPFRFDLFDIKLRNDFEKEGHVIVVGMGPKSRNGLRLHDWERRALLKMQRRFPARRIVYRPKVGYPRDGVRWGLIEGARPIEKVLRGASLVVTRHSNVAVDACIAGIPVECEDGAARWLYKSGAVQSEERRLSFLRRLAWWNWRAAEMEEAWKFVLARM